VNAKAQDDELVMELVEMALASPPHDIERYLQEACGGDPALLLQVRSYVEWEQRMEGFLAEPLYPRAFLEHPFEPGQLLEHRFRITREIAQGGMGIVYEAVDEKLERRIALKCAKVGFRKRLPPEVRNASDISHPNVCKIFEIHTAATEHGDLDFLTMEFLEGETLAERLRRGPFSHREARVIALQLCAGLAEAHRKHVVHGDLKSSNIILARDDGDIRAVITDFGLARRPDTTQRSLQSGEIAGTPDYMAPELWKGAKASVASDIYALGVILREMVAGADVNSRWKRVVQRCLKEEPAERFAAADGVALEIAPQSRRWFLASAAAAVLAVISGVVTYKTTTAPVETVRLAMLPFDSASSDLSREIAGQLRTVRGSQKTRLTIIPFGQGLRSQVDSPEKAMTSLGATHVLHGTVRNANDRLMVHAYITDPRSSARIREFKGAYAAGESRYIRVALAGMVTATFHLPAVTEGAAVNAAARQHYRNGLAYMRRDSDVNSAVDAMQKAVAGDPDSPLTHAGQAEAWWWKYFITKDKKFLGLAEDSLKEAQRRNQDLAPVHRVAGLLSANKGLYEQALNDYLRAIELEPDNSDNHRRIGIAYDSAGHSDRAIAAFRRAIELDPDNHRNYQALGTHYYENAEYGEAIKYFKKTVEVAPQESSTHYALATAYIDSGDFADAERELRTALVLGETPAVLNNLAVTLMYQGRDQEAIPYLTRALGMWPERPLWWLNLGIAYRRMNLVGESERANRRGLTFAEAELIKNPRSGFLRSCIAYLSARLGDRRRSQFEIAQALSIGPKDKQIEWMAMLTFEALGQRNDAIKLLESTSYAVLADVSRFPDLADLAQDSRFLTLLGLKRDR
jgi:serine/threonine protein kinase